MNSVEKEEKKLKRFFVFLFLFFLLVPLCRAEQEQGKADLLIMVYMSGGDLESLGGSASRDLQEMAEALCGDGRVRVAAMLSGARTWHSDISSRETSIWEVTPNGPEQVKQMELMSMGEASTLACFLNECAQQFPSERYALIIWDHGAGPLAGVCFDEMFAQSGEQDRLSMHELAGALRASPFSEKGLSFIGFDACLMSSMEVAWTVSPFTDCMVASEEKEWAEGWDYGFLRQVSGTETGKEIGRKILDSYRASAQDSWNPVTLSVLDLTCIEEAGKELDGFFRKAAEDLCAENYREYASCRALAKMPGGAAGPYFDLVDLCDLIGLYEEKGLADGSRLLDALRKMTAETFSMNDDYVSGISIYAPFDNKPLYVSSWAKRYGEMAFVPGYQAFVKKISDLYMGEALFQWKSQYQTQIQEEQGTVRVKVEFSPEEGENIARARLIVVEDLGDGTYQQVYADRNGLKFFEDAVTAKYRGESLYQVDAQGNILAGPLTYYPVEGGIALQGILYYPFDPVADFYSQKIMDTVEMIYREDEDHRLTFSEVLILEEPGLSGTENGLYLRSSADIRECESLEIYPSGPAGDMNGIRDTGTYRITGMPTEISLKNGAPELRFLPVYHRHDRYAYLRLTDLQGNMFCSDVVQIPNPTVIPLTSDRVSDEKDGIAVTCDMVGLVTGYEPGILVGVVMENHSDGDLIADVQSFLMDGASLGMERKYASLCPAGETIGISAFIPAKYIPEEKAEQMEIVVEGQDENGTVQTWNLIIPMEADFSVLDGQ